jgi:prophage tail gpP-like protein
MKEGEEQKGTQFDTRHIWVIAAQRIIWIIAPDSCHNGREEKRKKERKIKQRKTKENKLKFVFGFLSEAQVTRIFVILSDLSRQ